MQDYPFHPLCEQYPMMPDAEFTLLVADMKANGYDQRFPIFLFDGKILDGRTKYLAAKQAKVEPVFKNLPKDTDLEAFVERANEHRRHLTPEWITAKRKERVARVVEKKIGGKSNVVIANEEGVSEGQVRRDLESHVTSSGGDEVTSATGQVVGRNGRVQTATPAKPDPLTCEGCKRKKRVGQKPAKKCPDCKKLRDAAKLAKDVEAAKNEPEEEPDEPPTVEEEIKSENSVLEKYARGLEVYLASVPDDPWLHDLDRWKMALSKAKAITETIRSAKCYKPCPLCKGEKCAKCHKTGRVTKYAYQQMV